MSCLIFLMTLMMGAFAVASAYPQESSVFDVTQLTDRIYKLSTDGGGYTVKIIVSVGEDGILLVDAGQKATAEDLKKQVLEFGKGIPKYIISTHAHVEHTGGNSIFGAAPVVIGHKNLRTTLRSGLYLFDEFPDESLPEITFSDSMSLFFNNEEIKLIAYPGAHDNSDIIIWFTESKIVCVGALSNGSHFPSVDGGTGDIRKYPGIVGEVISILPDDVTIIPGHGEDGTIDDFRAFHDMLVETTNIVRTEMARGKDAATLQEEDVLADWASFEGSYVNRNQWIQYLARGFTNPDYKKTIFEPMYYAIKEKGVEESITHYHDLKNNHREEYEFDGNELFYIGYKLYLIDKLREAVKFFELSTNEYPEGKTTWMCYHFAGKIYREMGDKETAKAFLKKSLELNPDDTEADEILKELDRE
ncbi:MAG: MBL fold metallo-hydrolase [Candidatus Zixiibacteriota bacterium]|nr:MAG: MBL fold metallo-hydrolase [candidate division Zixibacteria bacterium]